MGGAKRRLGRFYRQNSVVRGGEEKLAAE